MSSKPVVIAARGLGKSYNILHKDEQKLSATEAVMRRLRRPFGSMTRETHWALRDVSFDLHEGEVVGIIGRNGAGKSTLLKLLSRITEPTRGQIGIWGRVGSLLEVGTGFHPQLTGRENIYLNGSILGMKRSDIRAQFDDIVAFSGVEKFLDTPVKRYSSGMHVRLAFAVAVHLKPEILIVDEVLAVGDGDFQRRCLGKMDEVARSGRTVLLVSHNMGSIQALCNRVMFFENGELREDGKPEEVVGTYLSRLQTIAGSTADNPDDRPGNGLLRVRSLRILSEAGEALQSVMGGEDLIVEMDYDSAAPGKGVTLSLSIYNDAGVVACAAHTLLTRPDLGPLARHGTFRCRMHRVPLTTGSYRLAVAVQIDGETTDHLARAATLDVVASVFYPTGVALDSKSAAFHLDHAWDHRPAAAPPELAPRVESVRG